MDIESFDICSGILIPDIMHLKVSCVIHKYYTFYAN